MMNNTVDGDEKLLSLSAKTDSVRKQVDQAQVPSTTKQVNSQTSTKEKPGPSKNKATLQRPIVDSEDRDQGPPILPTSGKASQGSKFASGIPRLGAKTHLTSSQSTQHIVPPLDANKQKNSSAKADKTKYMGSTK